MSRTAGVPPLQAGEKPRPPRELIETPEGAPAGVPPSEPAKPAVRTALETLGLIVAPATALTALLVYFGWARTRAEMAYFGIDMSVLELSTQDYVLRSVGSVFWALVVIIAAGVLALVIYRASAALLPDRAWRRRFRIAGFGATALGCALLLVGTVAIVWRPITAGTLVVTPAVFVLGVAMTAYGVWVLAAVLPKSSRAERKRLDRGLATLVGALIVVFLFWTVGDYADVRGRAIAAFKARQLDSRPTLVLYSKERLHMAGLGVDERKLGRGPYRYRYSDLKLLIRSGGKLFLVPSNWSREKRLTIVVPESSNLRFEFHCSRSLESTVCQEVASDSSA